MAPLGYLLGERAARALREQPLGVNDQLRAGAQMKLERCWDVPLADGTRGEYHRVRDYFALSLVCLRLVVHTELTGAHVFAHTLGSSREPTVRQLGRERGAKVFEEGLGRQSFEKGRSAQVCGGQPVAVRNRRFDQLRGPALGDGKIDQRGRIECRRVREGR